MLRRLAPLFVILALGAVCIGGYFLFSDRMETQTTLQMLEKHHKAIIENRRSLEGQSSKHDALKKQYETVRKQVEEKIGKEALSYIEQPICKRWESIAEGFAYQTISCGEHLGRWLKIVLVGPTTKKEKLYKKLEEELHPVEVRSCHASKFDESNSKIVIVMLDKYNDDPPIGQYLHFDPAILEESSMPSGKEFKEIVAQINNEMQTVRSMVRKAAESQQYKQKSGLLLLVLSTLDGRTIKRFSLSEMEKNVSNE